MLQQSIGLDEGMLEVMVASSSEDVWILDRFLHEHAPRVVHSSKHAPFVRHLLQDVFAAKNGLQVKPTARHSAVVMPDMT